MLGRLGRGRLIDEVEVRIRAGAGDIPPGAALLESRCRPRLVDRHAVRRGVGRGVGGEIDVGDAFRYVLATGTAGSSGSSCARSRRSTPRRPRRVALARAAVRRAAARPAERLRRRGICLAAKPFLGGRSTVNRGFFDKALAARTKEEAAGWWLLCLQAGDAMAHYGLGYTLLDLGRTREAYRHLRSYTGDRAAEPSGRGAIGGGHAEGIGDADDARTSYRRAIALEREGGETTDAAMLLAAMD